MTKLLAAAGFGFFAVLWLGGVVAYAVHGAPPAGSEWTAPVFLALGALLMLGGAASGDGSRPGRLVAVAVFGFLIEAVGVATGWPFGSYAYSEALGPRLAGVPLVLGAAWLLVASWADGLARCFTVSKGWRIVLAALLMTGLDLVLDPLAAGPLGYWSWPAGGVYHGVPASNFAGWLGAGLVAQLLLAPARPPGRLERTVGRALLVFFTLLAVLLGLSLPALVGMALVVTEGWGSRRRPVGEILAR